MNTVVTANDDVKKYIVRLEDKGIQFEKRVAALDRENPRNWYWALWVYPGGRAGLEKPDFAQIQYD
jgi:hypothetical protein